MSHKKIVRLFSLFFTVILLISAVSVTEVKAQTSKPQIIAQAKTNIRELPWTGLPLAAWGIAAALPGGLILRKLFKKEKADKSAGSIWNDRNLNS